MASFHQLRQDMHYLLQHRRALFIEMIIRILICTIVTVNIDGFLKAIVTPTLVATGIGAIVAPMTFFMGQALQPIINSICFFHFDDRFVMASLEVSGSKERLMTGLALEKWGRMGLREKIFMRYCVVKLCAGFFIGLAGIFAFIPILGPIIVALSGGWAMTWDMVYVPLSCMGYHGVVQQGKSVHTNFRKYYWFGFWAVLIEEIPIVGPTCHVYNVYSAAAFLEMVYLGNAAASADDDSDGKKRS